MPCYQLLILNTLSSAPLGTLYSHIINPRKSILFFKYFLNIFLCLFLRERETECEQARGRERGRHRIWSRLCAISTQPDAGLEPTSREIMTWAEVRCSTDWATQVPLFTVSLIYKGTEHIFMFNNNLHVIAVRCSCPPFASGFLVFFFSVYRHPLYVKDSDRFCSYRLLLSA